MAIRVLAIHSFNDAGSKKRIVAAKSAIELQECHVENICIYDTERDGDLITEREAILDDIRQSGDDTRYQQERQIVLRKIVHDCFFPALRSKVIAFKPEVCMVHSGTLFSVFPRPMREVLQEMRHEFVDVKWGLERMPSWLFNMKIRALTLDEVEKTELLELIDFVRAHFETSDLITDLDRGIFG